jgi:hypothetical protein
MMPVALLRGRARKPMATREIPITGLCGCHNAMKEETVQGDCRETEEMGWEG